MAISVHWDNESETIIRMDFTGGWNFTNFRAAIDEVHSLADEENNPAFRGVIVDLSHETFPPIGAVPHFKHAISGGGETPRPVIFVGSDSVTKSLFTMLIATYKIRRPIHFVNTVAEAYPVLDSGFEAIADEEASWNKATENTVNP